MRCFRFLFATALLLAAVAERAMAFSLVGPAAQWMTQRLGYNVNPQTWPGGQGWGGAGPMQIGEEYRFNFPTISYAYSPEFLNYFGQRGVDEVEKAIAILNNVPSMNTININDFPLSGIRINHRAQALGLVDVKSAVLSGLIAHIGLSDPTRWVFTLRNRWTDNVSTNYYVIKRNFDPDTWQHSSFINGQLWTYSQVIDISDAESFVFTEPVDPLALGGLLNAPVASGIVGNGLLPLGGFWTGLTRDDVGGLRYIYRHDNYNIETAPTNSFGAGVGVATGGSSSPWTIPVFSTNAGTALPGATTNFVDQALRAGVDKLTFTRVPLQSVLGPYLSNTVAFVDRFITNGVERQQNLIRAQQVPDIIFDTGDLNGADTDQAFPLGASGAQAWITAANGTNHWGPGIIPPSVGTAPSLQFVLNNVGPAIYNAIINGVFFISEINNVGRFFLWGSFDGSSDDPFIYPQNTSTELVEQLVLGARGGGGAGGTGASLVDVWTPSSLVLLPPGSLGNAAGGAGGAGGGGVGTTP